MQLRESEYKAVYTSLISLAHRNKTASDGQLRESEHKTVYISCLPRPYRNNSLRCPCIIRTQSSVYISYLPRPYKHNSLRCPASKMPFPTPVSANFFPQYYPSPPCSVTAPPPPLPLASPKGLIRNASLFHLLGSVIQYSFIFYFFLRITSGNRNLPSARREAITLWNS